MIFVLSIVLVVTYWINVDYGFFLSTLILLLSLGRNIFIRKKYYFNFKDILFVIYAVIALMPIVSYRLDINVFFRIIIYPWLLTLIFQNIDYNTKRLKILYASIIVVAIILSSIMFFQASPGTFKFNLDYILTKEREFGFYFLNGNVKLGPTTIASVILVTISGLMFFRKFSTNWKTSLLLFLSILFFLMLLIISGGRNALLTFLIILTIYYFLNIKQKSRSVFIQLLSFSLILGFLFFIFNIAILFQNNDFVARLYGLINPTSDSSIMTRMYLWGSALLLIGTNPGGLGFSYFFDKYGLTTHNEFLAQLVATGIIGAIVYYILLFYIGKNMFVSLKNNIKNKNVLAYASYFSFTIFTIALFSMFTENISYSSQNILYPILWITVGVFFGVKRKS